MSQEIKYKIFSESLKYPCYIVKDSNGNQLEFSRNDWANCKLNKNEKTLVKIDVMEYQPLVVELNFAFGTTLNSILFSRSSSFSFKVKGNYQTSEIKEINWKWNVSSFWTNKFTLIDKNNDNNELAKIKEFEMGDKISGSLTISYEVPSEFHELIIVSACLAVKVAHDELISKDSRTGAIPHSSLSNLQKLFSSFQ